MQVPAVILVCRNSTDTAYFQRLRPYPRIMLLRYNTRFKDYVRPLLSCLHLRPCLVTHLPRKSCHEPDQAYVGQGPQCRHCKSDASQNACLACLPCTNAAGSSLSCLVQDKTPIGFGVAIFCIAKASCRCACLKAYPDHSHIICDVFSASG